MHFRKVLARFIFVAHSEMTSAVSVRHFYMLFWPVGGVFIA